MLNMKQAPKQAAQQAPKLDTYPGLGKPKRPSNLRFLVAGTEGIGKTTLGAKFPKPVFLPLEDGLISVCEDSNVDAFDLVENMDDCRAAMKFLEDSNHGYRTLVVDSITALTGLMEAEIMKGEKKAQSINQALGGYGAGQAALASKCGKFCLVCRSLMRSKKMHIVWIGHEIVETVQPPDSTSYDRRTIAGAKKAIAPFLQNADVVGFIRESIETVTEGKGDNKREIGVGLGTREIMCMPEAGSVAKNRLGIKEPLPFSAEGGNPFEKWVN